MNIIQERQPVTIGGGIAGFWFLFTIYNNIYKYE
jgi:hypothetical protein